MTTAAAGTVMHYAAGGDRGVAGRTSMQAQKAHPCDSHAASAPSVRAHLLASLFRRAVAILPDGTSGGGTPGRFAALGRCLMPSPIDRRLEKVPDWLFSRCCVRVHDGTSSVSA